MNDEPKFEPGHGYTQEDWDEVSDNPEWTAEDFANAKPFAEALPQLAASMRRGRGKQASPTKELVTVRLSRTVLEKLRAHGPGWQTRMNAFLEESIDKL